MSEQLNCDALIAGGGPVGLLLALGLSQQGFDVVLAEKYLPETGAKNSFDGRVLALSYGSMCVLQHLGVWDALQPSVTEIHHVHVSQKGYLGITKLHAEELDVPALGYSVQSSDLGKVLWQAINSQTEIKVICPAELTQFEMDETSVSAQISTANDGGCQVQAKLIVGADGTDSFVRTHLGLPIEVKSYNASAIIAQIETEQHPEHWSYERFTEEGPVALLPMNGHFHKAVLVCPQEKIAETVALNDEQFIDLFATKMGERLGAFTSISTRVAYPLKETYAPVMVKGRAVLMGNASHTQHPVAAQGLNLGIRDVSDFLQQVSIRLDSVNADIGNAVLLENYAQQRKPDHEKVMGMTDSLIDLFQHSSPIVGHMRGIGLMAMQAFSSMKKRFARFAMGGADA